MKLQDFDYHLPEELIAQYRLENRDESRLLVMDTEGSLTDSIFYKLPEFLEEGDFLILNDSKVIKAQLTLLKDSKEIVVNLNKQLTSTIWSALASPARKLVAGDSFDFDGNILIIKENHGDGFVDIEFNLKKGISVIDFLDIFGAVPLPPYIRGGHAEEEDENTYQTIYSKNEGSVAAPTAGLHFTDEVFVNLKKKNIDYSFVTLHVGAGTFLAVRTEDINQHKMHSEYGSISEETAERINNAKKEGRRIITVGTTSTRTVETSALRHGHVVAGDFETDLYIRPGFEFKVADRLITNFHQPKSTLMMLVSAFAGHENIMNAYKHAVDNKYRFHSYGDAMLITKKI
jgi:S-adenosylmethionine:tRNA ribosyltransferase-isomerase